MSTNEKIKEKVNKDGKVEEHILSNNVLSTWNEKEVEDKEDENI